MARRLRRLLDASNVQRTNRFADGVIGEILAATVGRLWPEPRGR
jgi:hypothetical protein